MSTPTEKHVNEYDLIASCALIRWLEYFVTASAMMIVILSFTGFPILQLWMAAVIVNGITMWIGYDISSFKMSKFYQKRQATYQLVQSVTAIKLRFADHLECPDKLECPDNSEHRVNILFAVGCVLQAMLWLPLLLLNFIGMVQVLIAGPTWGMTFGIIFFFVNFGTFCIFPAIFLCQWGLWSVRDMSGISPIDYEEIYILASFVSKFLWILFFFATVHQWLSM